MRSVRVYLNEELALNHAIKIEHQTYIHLIKVLRLKVNTHFYAFNGDGKDYLLNIENIDKRHLMATVLNAKDANNLSPLKSTIYLALAKPEHMDWSIQKCTELGVNNIIPFISERTQGRLKEKQIDKKVQHWKNIIISACEQSGRADIPYLSFPLSLKQLLESIKKTNHNYIMHFDKQALTFNEIELDSNLNVAIICGSEGGFSDEEIRLIKPHAKILTLGSRILRTETAAVTALSILQNKFGDII